MTIFKIIFFIFLILGLFLALTRKYVNPYKLIFLFGKKGSGKSTLLQKLTYRYLKRGWTVYSTEVASADPHYDCESHPVYDCESDPELNDSYAELNDVMSFSLDEERMSRKGGEGTASFDNKNAPPVEPPLPSSPKGEGRTAPFRRGRFLSELHYIDPTKIFDYEFPERSCILIDEVSLIWDNRDFKKMDKRVVEWFRYQRHHKCRVYFFSQTFDIDKKLRDLCDDMYLVNKYFRVLVVASHIVRKPVVVHPGPESPARIDDDMIVDGPLLTFFGGKLFAFIPYWARKFDSYTTDYKRKEVSGAQ